jgi:hypothetical protein
MTTPEGPVRVRLSKHPKFRLPANTVRVGYGTRWANPWEHHAKVPYQNGRSDVGRRTERAHQMAAGMYRRELLDKGRVVVPATRWKAELVTTVEDIKRELVGKNVACWCQLYHACHGDVLIEVANDWPSPSLLLGIHADRPSLVIQEAVAKIEQMYGRKS